jgi:hypothetical protein
MSSFTTISGGTDLFHVDLLNQLWLGWSERAQVASEGEKTLIAVGDDMQLYSRWAELQAGVEGLCSLFADCSAATDGKFDDATAIPAYTLASFRAYAGIHANGVRRATAWDPSVDNWQDLSDPMFSHGVMQAGDIIGPWIWVDIQRMLTALKWTVVPGNSYFPVRYATCGFPSGGRSFESWTAALQELEASSWGTWTEDDEGALCYKVAAYLMYNHVLGLFYGQGQRQMCKIECNVSTCVPCAIDVYFRTYLPMYDIGHYFETYVDADSLGHVVDRLHYHETWPVVSPPTATRGGEAEASWFVDSDVNPATLIDLSNPGWDEDLNSYRDGACGAHDGDEQRLVCKWAFTNA